MQRKKNSNKRKANFKLDLEPGQAVWHQDCHIKKWNSGWIKEKLQKPHSYMIDTKDGACYRRNRNFTKPRQVPSTTENDHSYNLGWSGLPKASVSGPATSQTASPDAIPGLIHFPAKKSNSTPGRIGATSGSPRRSTHATK